jgi:hypothetical protein
VRNTGTIVLLFFDDIDLLLASRSDSDIGGSDKDVLNITMQFLDGAFTKHIGNAQTYAATNEPTATDSALRQRFHHREAIDGPEDWDDYAALIGIKLARQIKRGLVQVGGELPTVQMAQGSGVGDQGVGGWLIWRRSWRRASCSIGVTLRALEPCGRRFGKGRFLCEDIP